MRATYLLFVRYAVELSRENACARLAPLIAASFFFMIGCETNRETVDSEKESELRFVDVASEVGLGDFRHVNGSEGLFWFPEQMGAGGGFVDYDGDQWEDIVLVGGGRLSPAGPADVMAVRLFHNERDGTFSETTDAAGLSGVRAYGTGVAAADIDNDGDQDILLTTFGENLLFRNDFDPQSKTRRVFTEAARDAGIAGPASWSSSALFLDADLDGFVDLYVAGYASWSIGSDVDCRRSGGEADYCPPATYPSDRSYFYRNRGDGTFEERTAEAGLAGSPGKSLAVAEWDFNQDGWPDIVVVNDGERDLLYMNKGGGTFEEQGLAHGIALGEHGEARAGMGVDVGVVDSAGLPSIFVGNFSSEMIGVYQQTSTGWFRDRAAVSGIGRSSLTTLAFGVILFDAELDGDLDLYVANGHVYLDPLDGSAYRQPPHLFVNEGNGRFTDAAVASGGVLQRPMVARAVAKADYDRDGDIDLLVTENDGPVHLLRNDSSRGGVVRIRLEGSSGNRDALGAQAATIVRGKRMTDRVRTGSGYLSQSEKVLTFGLGGANQIDTLSVRWPDGSIESFESVPAGYEYRIVEGQGIVERTALPISK